MITRRSVLLLGSSFAFTGLLHGCGGSDSQSEGRSPYRITDLSDTFSTVSAVNNRGQIVGFKNSVAVLSTPGGVTTPIAAPNGSQISTQNPLRLNDNGAVTGTHNPNVGYENTRSFLWIDGSVQDIGTLGGSLCIARDINNRNQIVGYSRNSTESTGQTTRAFLWQNGQITDLGTLGGGYSDAYAINDRGQITGVSRSSERDTQGVERLLSVVWENGTQQVIGPIEEGIQQIPTDINENGQVVGQHLPVYPVTAEQFYAFLWSSGTQTNLTAAGAEPRFLSAVAINASGDIVGGYYGFSGGGAADGIPEPPLPEYAYLFRGGKTYDLQTMIPSNSGWTLKMATGINDQGQIIGHGLKNGQSRPFLLTSTNNELG